MDLFIVLACLFFLVMNMGIIAGGARRKAKQMLCLSRLLKWGQIFQTYANDNDGHLISWHELDPGDETYAPPGVSVDFHEYCWVPRLHKYYDKPIEYVYEDEEGWVFNGNWDFCLCPSTNVTWKNGYYEGPHTGWDFRWLHEYAAGEWWPYYDSSYGSYGKNSWVSDTNVAHGAADCDPAVASYWDTVRVSEAGSIPLFGDCSMMGGFPNVHCEIPQERIREPMAQGDEISRWVQDRHTGGVNMLFLDFSARRVELKQLWQLPWQRCWDLTAAPDPQNPEIWPDWMNEL